MPVRIRLAANGAARNCRIVGVHRATSPPRLLERGHEQLDVVVEELDVVGRPPCSPPTDGGSTSTLPPVSRAIGLRRLEVEVRLDEDDLDALRASSRAMSSSVWRGRRRDAGLRLDVADHVEAEAVDEVRPGAVVGHDLRCPCTAPSPRPSASRPSAEALVEVGVALLRSRPRRPARAARACRDRLRDPAAVAGIEPVVRVALRVHVAHRARDLAGRDLEDLRTSATRRGSRGAGLDLARCGSA